jgi:hypothetical protein
MPDFGDLWAGGANKTKSTPLVNSLIIFTGAGVLYGLTGWSGDSGTVYVFTFDSATVPANINPMVAGTPWIDDCIQLSAPGTFSISIPPTGRYYKNGCVVMISSTAPPVLTIATTSKATFTGLWAPQFGGGQP